MQVKLSDHLAQQEWISLTTLASIDDGFAKQLYSEIRADRPCSSKMIRAKDYLLRSMLHSMNAEAALAKIGLSGDPIKVKIYSDIATTEWDRMNSDLDTLETLLNP
jgi:hypothetical protein